MRKILALVAFFVVCWNASAQELRFRADGTFKIVQLTDLHYQLDNPKSAPALQNIDNALVGERPDLVVLTGDIIYSSPAKATLLKVLERLAAHNIPWVYEFGNHDYEQGLSNRQLYDIAREVKGCAMPPVAAGQELDFVLPVRSHDGSRVAANLYCMDSHAYAPKGYKTDGYAWFTFDQVAWYRSQARAIKAANGGRTIPALAFFHIPLPEYHDAVRDENAIMMGIRQEACCSPRFNSGMFAAMYEGGDVMGMFAGHDHDNDYSVMWHGILLAYGRFGGGNTEYNHLTPGARIIILKEGRRAFDTYIRQIDGTVVNRSSYPASYVQDDWRKR